MPQKQGDGGTCPGALDAIVYGFNQWWRNNNKAQKSEKTKARTIINRRGVKTAHSGVQNYLKWLTLAILVGLWVCKGYLGKL